MIQRKPTEFIDMDDATLDALLDRLEHRNLEQEDFQTISETLKSYYYVTRLIDKKAASISRLRDMLFGATTESTSNVLGRNRGSGSPDSEPGTGNGSSNTTAAEAQPSSPATTSSTAGASGKQPPKGHGRNGVKDFPAAEHVFVAYVGLKSGCACPKCVSGTAYNIGRPKTLIRFKGHAPVSGTVYELETLRCDLCGEIFTATPPAGVGAEKYDATVVSVIGLLKYGRGMPFNRLDEFQEDLGIPLPASTQWELVDGGASVMAPVHQELIRQAAQGEVVYNDDTTVKILELARERSQATVGAEATNEASQDDDGEGRTGIYTTGIVSTLKDQRRIALFFSGGKHAGENLEKVLAQRAAELPPPIQMCDALSRNYPQAFQTIIANCLAHARRKFVEQHSRFEDECRHVLEVFEKVYINDDDAKKQHLSPDERLKYHQAHSGPILEDLREWMKRQIELKLIETNSGLGGAINYLRKHWDKLTLFLRVPGAPLDNNICERALKKAILHRKNALFYQTQRGADVGDLYMSLIFTCDLNDVNPFDYLTQLQRHADEVKAAPDSWLPWNYRDNLSSARAGPETEAHTPASATG